MPSTNTVLIEKSVLLSYPIIHSAYQRTNLLAKEHQETLAIQCEPLIAQHELHLKQLTQKIAEHINDISKENIVTPYNSDANFNDFKLCLLLTEEGDNFNILLKKSSPSPFYGAFIIGLEVDFSNNEETGEYIIEKTDITDSPCLIDHGDGELQGDVLTQAFYALAGLEYNINKYDSLFTDFVSFLDEKYHCLKQQAKLSESTFKVKEQINTILLDAIKEQFNSNNALELKERVSNKEFSAWLFVQVFVHSENNSTKVIFRPVEFYNFKKEPDHVLIKTSSDCMIKLHRNDIANHFTNLILYEKSLFTSPSSLSCEYFSIF